MRKIVSPAALLAWVLFLLVPILAVSARAQTIADIVSHGKIRVGVNTGAPPFDQIDSHGKGTTWMSPISSASTLVSPWRSCRWRQRHGFPRSKRARLTSWWPPLLPPRSARTVAFIMPYCTFDLPVFAPKTADLKTVGDLNAHSVGFNRNTSQERFIALLTAQGTTVQRYDDVALTVQALLSHQVDSVAIPVTMGQDMIRDRPQAGIEEKFVFFSQPNSIAVRRDAFEFRQWLNNFVYFIKQDGELDAISRKWIGTPLPTMPVF